MSVEEESTRSADDALISVVTGKTQGKHGKLLHDYLGDRWVQVEKDLVEWGMHVFSE